MPCCLISVPEPSEGTVCLVTWFQIGPKIAFVTSAMVRMPCNQSDHGDSVELLNQAEAGQLQGEVKRLQAQLQQVRGEEEEAQEQRHALKLQLTKVGAQQGHHTMLCLSCLQNSLCQSPLRLCPESGVWSLLACTIVVKARYALACRGHSVSTLCFALHA